MSSAVDSQEAPQTAATTTGPLLHCYCPMCRIDAQPGHLITALCGHVERLCDDRDWTNNPPPQDCCIVCVQLGDVELLRCGHPGGRW